MVLLALCALSAQAAPKKEAADCLPKCEKSKTDCMAQYTKSDMTSGKYVTPEGVKVCMAGYRDCKQACPKPGGRK